MSVEKSWKTLIESAGFPSVLDDIFGHLKEGIAVRSGEGSFLYRNPSFIELLSRDFELFKDILEAQQPDFEETIHMDDEYFAIFGHTLIAEDGDRLQLIRIENHTDLQHWKHRAEESELRYNLAAQSTNDGLWDWDLESDEIFLSKRWLNMLGYTEEDFKYNLADWLNIIHPHDKKNFSIQLNNYLKFNPENRFNLEYRIADRNGEYRWMMIQGMLLTNSEGAPTRFTGAHTDVTERKRMEQQLIHDSLHDGLTDLPNRLLFRENLQNALKKREEGILSSFAIIQFDLDSFQNVNNGMGHLFGDHVLITVADRIKSMVTSTDTVARLGGDEFALLLEAGHTPESVSFFANKLQEKISAPIRVHNQEVVITASMGIVLTSSDHKLVTDILVDTATALHKARGDGGTHWVVFSKDMRQQAQSRIRMENRLRAAIDNEEMEVHFQPIYDCEQGRVGGFEALVRWNHADEGRMIYPDEFIPLAEETGLILPLGEYVLQKSCENAVEWNKHSPKEISVSVNLSAKQFRQPDIHLTVGRVLTKTGLSPHLLHVEITESQIMEHALRTIEILKNMKNLGVQVSIDDFGTGYSSLAYLKRFPIDCLKIDRAFIKDLPFNPDDVAIAKAIVALSKSLGLRITAEGVETKEQVEFLEKMDIEELQGFVFSPAIPAKQVVAYFQNFKKPE